MKTEKQMLTYSYRIKDGNVANKLNKLARDVNFVWNYCNETSYNAIKQRRKFLTKTKRQKSNIVFKPFLFYYIESGSIVTLL